MNKSDRKSELDNILDIYKKNINEIGVGKAFRAFRTNLKLLKLGKSQKFDANNKALKMTFDPIEKNFKKILENFETLFEQRSQDGFDTDKEKKLLNEIYTIKYSMKLVIACIKQNADKCDRNEEDDIYSKYAEYTNTILQNEKKIKKNLEKYKKIVVENLSLGNIIESREQLFTFFSYDENLCDLAIFKKDCFNGIMESISKLIELCDKKFLQPVDFLYFVEDNITKFQNEIERIQLKMTERDVFDESRFLKIHSSLVKLNEKILLYKEEFNLEKNIDIKSFSNNFKLEDIEKIAIPSKSL